MDTSFTDRHWQSPDGLTLRFRDYGSATRRPPVICLHGLTRNARDFEDLAPHIAAQGWRVLGTTRSPDKAEALAATGVTPVLWEKSALDAATPVISPPAFCRLLNTSRMAAASLLADSFSSINSPLARNVSSRL